MKKLIVIKIGTGVVASDCQLKTAPFYSLAGQVAELKRRSFGVILVSSGGVAAGNERMVCLGAAVSDYQKSELAGIGSRHLLNRWGDALALHCLEVMQCWLTYGNLRLKGEKESIRSKLRRFAFDSRVVPVVNENDVVSALEIKKMRVGLGDNDRLARIIARLVSADAILFVTETGGVYSANPTLDARAKLLGTINARRHPRLPRKSSGPSRNGTGGMQSKLNQAGICARVGIDAFVLGVGDVLACMQGKRVGTHVAA